jgi:hypothetical protein
VEAVRAYIQTHNHITLPFKLRVHVGGVALFLKASQTLEEVAAMGAEVIGVNYNDAAARQSARRQLAKETAALVRTDVRQDGDKTREQVRSSTDAVKECIRDEVKKLLGSGGNHPGGGKRANTRLVGTMVVAAQQDLEMGDETYEICHVESQTWADGAKHTVCIIKSEGKPSLSREFSSLVLHDPFVARDATHSVRVVVVPHQVEHAQFHTGWRGVVQAAKATAQNVKVNFPYLKEGVVAHTSVSVPRQHLEVLAADDISMSPNRHPWLARRVRTQTGQLGEIVRVDRGRVKLALEGPTKRVLFIDSKGSSFEALFSEEPVEAQVSRDPPQAVEVEAQATPQQPQAVEVEPPLDSQEAAQSIADSDAESEGTSPTPGSKESVEPTRAPSAPPPKRRKQRGEQQPVKGATVKRPAVKRPASANLSAPKRRRNVFSLANVD